MVRSTKMIPSRRQVPRDNPRNIGGIGVEEVANNADFGLSDLVINLFFPQPTPDALDPLHPELGTFEKIGKRVVSCGMHFCDE